MVKRTSTRFIARMIEGAKPSQMPGVIRADDGNHFIEVASWIYLEQAGTESIALSPALLRRLRQCASKLRFALASPRYTALPAAESARPSPTTAMPRG